jgi:hypothetical protein
MEQAKFIDYARYVTELQSKSGKWSLYGDTLAQIVVCGHSHAASILEAATLPIVKSKSETAIAVCYSTDWTTGPPGDKEYWEFVTKLSREKNIVIVWNGNQHIANFLFQTNPPFEFIDAQDELSEEKFQPIPRTMIKEFFETYFLELDEVVPLMANANSITLMSGPAPKPLAYIKTRIKDEPFFAEVANSLQVDLDSLAISSDLIRLELWKLVSEMLETRAKYLGVGFLPPPDEAVDSHGMLLEKYSGLDVSHANAEYGALLIEKILDYFEVKPS